MKKVQPVQNKKLQDNVLNIAIADIKVRKPFAPREQVVPSAKRYKRIKSLDKTLKEY